MNTKLFEAKNILLVIPFTIIIIAPFSLLDQTLLKFFVLCFFTMTFGIAIIKLKYQSLKDFRFLISMLSALILLAAISVSKSKSPISENLFGNFGRQIGFLTYLFLVILLLSCALISDTKILSYAKKYITYSLIIVIIYSLMQASHADPIKWNLAQGHVFSFLGNPNFLSAFLGMTSSILNVRVLNINISRMNRLISLLGIMLVIFVIIQSGSRQGFIPLFISNVLIIFIWFCDHPKYKKIRFPFLLISAVCLLLGLIDLLQTSPWKPLIYEESVSFRGDFWRAGFAMAQNNPFFGVGFAGYKDNYLNFRDEVASTRINKENFVDSAHSIFIDAMSSSGFIYFIVYMVLIFYVTLIGLKNLVKNFESKNDMNLFFAIWLGYLSQALISIETIPIATIGWVSAGLIVGDHIKRKEKLQQLQESKLALNSSSAILGLILTISLSMPQIIADAGIKNGIESGNLKKIIEATQKWPKDTGRLNFVSNILTESKLFDSALIVAREAVKHNPHNFIAWQNLYSLPGITDEERTQAIINIKKLNP